MNLRYRNRVGVRVDVPLLPDAEVEVRLTGTLPCPVCQQRVVAIFQGLYARVELVHTMAQAGTCAAYTKAPRRVDT